jgi:hypothetical protein
VYDERNKNIHVYPSADQNGEGREARSENSLFFPDVAKPTF